MSNRPSARVMSVEDELLIEYDPDECIEQTSFSVGYPLVGKIVLVTHECPFCHSSMQTVGTGHGEYLCSNCAATRARDVKMVRRYESLEEE